MSTRPGLPFFPNEGEETLPSGTAARDLPGTGVRRRAVPSLPADTFNGLLCALREDLVLAYPLRDADALEAWAEEVLVHQEN